jgi:hypothetical protein
MNHRLFMQKLDTLSDLRHNVPNLLTFQRRGLVFDEIDSDVRWVLLAINIVVQVQVTQLHVDE